MQDNHTPAARAIDSAAVRQLSLFPPPRPADAPAATDETDPDLVLAATLLRVNGARLAYHPAGRTTTRYDRMCGPGGRERDVWILRSHSVQVRDSVRRLAAFGIGESLYFFADPEWAVREAAEQGRPARDILESEVVVDWIFRARAFAVTPLRELRRLAALYRAEIRTGRRGAESCTVDDVALARTTLAAVERALAARRT